MKVLVTGATGFIGTRVARELLDHGHDVLGLVRSGQETALSDGIRPVFGDLTDLDSLRAAASSVEGIAHLAAVSGPEFPTVDRQAAQALLDGLAPGAVLVYTSGAAVQGGTGDGIATEAAPRDRGSAMAWRGDTEDILLARAGGVRVAVVRPSVMVYGAPGSGLAGRMLASARSLGTVTYVGDGNTRLSTVRVEDLADLYVRALESPEARGVYNAASDDVVWVREVAEAAARAAGAATRSLSPSEADMSLGMVAVLLSTTVVVSGAKAREQLGWAPSPDGLLADLSGPAPWVTATLT